MIQYIRYIRVRPHRVCCGGSAFFIAVRDGKALDFGHTTVVGDVTHVSWLGWGDYDCDLPTTLPTSEIQVVRG